MLPLFFIPSPSFPMNKTFSPTATNPIVLKEQAFRTALTMYLTAINGLKTIRNHVQTVKACQIQHGNLHLTLERLKDKASQVEIMRRDPHITPERKLLADGLHQDIIGDFNNLIKSNNLLEHEAESVVWYMNSDVPETIAAADSTVVDASYAISQAVNGLADTGEEGKRKLYQLMNEKAFKQASESLATIRRELQPFRI
jgi:hypothetical protein